MDIHDGVTRAPDQRTDFKSNDPFVHIEAMVRRAVSSFETIYKEEGRE